MQSDHSTRTRTSRRLLPLAAAAGLIAPAGAALATAALTQLPSAGGGCASPAAGGDAGIGSGTVVGASEYGPPGIDPTVHGDRGAYAQLQPGDLARLQSGGPLFDALTPLSLWRVTATSGRSLIARVADWGTGGGAVDGHARAVDLWWQTANLLGLPGTSGAWTGLVRLARAPASGAGPLLDQTPPPPVTTSPLSALCAQPADSTGPQLVAGDRARILADGSAAAPTDAPPAVKAAIAAANQIDTKPYPQPRTHYDENLDWSWPAYDCSAAVSYVLYHAGLHSQTAQVSGQLESFGEPGPGRWITVYANSAHTWIVIAGLAFDTADYGGPNIPAGAGPRWRSDPTGNLADGLSYVARHPPGL